jgi:hypothetical protein
VPFKQIILAALLSSASFTGAHANGLQTIYSFHGETDGAQPQAPLIADDKGNFYGTT